MPTYIGNCVSPFFYGAGNSVNGPVVYPLPPDGTPEQPISLNTTFWIETRNFYVDYLFGEIPGYMVNFVPSGSNHFQRQWLIDVPGNHTIDAAFNFFNTVPENSSKTNGVIKILSAAKGDTLSSTVYYDTPKSKLLSARGEFTVEQYFFPWPQNTSPIPSRNQNGIQRGSIIKFFANDNSFLVCFELPQDIATKLNVMPS